MEDISDGELTEDVDLIIRLDSLERLEASVTVEPLDILEDAEEKLVELEYEELSLELLSLVDWDEPDEVEADDDDVPGGSHPTIKSPPTLQFTTPTCSVVHELDEAEDPDDEDLDEKEENDDLELFDEQEDEEVGLDTEEDCDEPEDNDALEDDKPLEDSDSDEREEEKLDNEQVEKDEEHDEKDDNEDFELRDEQEDKEVRLETDDDLEEPDNEESEDELLEDFDADV